MRFIGIDIGSQTHVVAAVDEVGAVLVKATPCSEDAAGYERLTSVIGAPEDALVAMEATGHYWRNLFATLAVRGFKIALLNPARTEAFAREELRRTKTDALDAMLIARFAQEKRPPPTPVSDEASQELRELVEIRDRMVQDLFDRVRQLHRLVDLCFPEFIQVIPGLNSQRATTVLHAFPTAQSLRHASVRRLTGLRHEKRACVDKELATRLIELAKRSVGQHHGEVYRMQVRFMCEDIDTLRTRVKHLDIDVENALQRHEIGRLLTTIDGVGPTTAARLVGKFGDFTHFESADQLAAHVGVIPALRHSGKSRPMRAGISGLGDASLRRALWMPTLSAVRRNPWLRHFYERLRQRGKLPKVALIAAMRKLLHAIYSVATNRRPFVPILPSPATAP